MARISVVYWFSPDTGNIIPVENRAATPILFSSLVLSKSAFISAIVAAYPGALAPPSAAYSYIVCVNQLQ